MLFSYKQYSILFWINLKNIERRRITIGIKVNKIKNWIAFKIKGKNYLQVLMLETIKLLESIEKKIDKINWWKHSSFRNRWSNISPL